MFCLELNTKAVGNLFNLVPTGETLSFLDTQANFDLKVCTS